MTTKNSSSNNGKQSGSEKSSGFLSFLKNLRKPAVSTAAHQGKKANAVPKPGSADKGEKSALKSIGRKPTDDELVSIWKEKHPSNLYGLGTFRRYSKGIWEPVQLEKIRQEFVEVMVSSKDDGIKPTSTILESMVKIAHAQLYFENEKWDSNPNIIVLKNGTVDLSTRKLREHRKNDYVTTSLPYKYDEKAEAPAFQRALGSLDYDVVQLIQEFYGYCLTQETKFEVSLWFFGPPGSGKSTIIEGLRAMLGDKAGNLGLGDLQHSQFALANIAGKNALISDEQPFGRAFATDTLKKIISGETTTTEQKYKPAEQIKPYAKLIWAMNEKPTNVPPGDGLFRRILPIEFPHLDKEKRDANLKQLVAKEGPGIFNWALEGLGRLYQRGRFDIPRSVQQANEDYQLFNDPAKQFIIECCDVGKDYTESADQLQGAYRNWCENNKYKIVSTVKAADDFKRLGYEKYKSAGRNRWKGIRLKVVESSPD